MVMFRSPANVVVVPGDSLALVAPDGVALLPPETHHELIDELESLLHSPVTAVDMVRRLIGMGALDLTSLAVAWIDDAVVRVVVRGDFVVTAAIGDSPRHIDANGVSSWREEALTGVDSVMIGAVPTATSTWISTGRIMAAALTWPVPAIRFVEVVPEPLEESSVEAEQVVDQDAGRPVTPVPDAHAPEPVGDEVLAQTSVPEPVVDHDPSVEPSPPAGAREQDLASVSGMEPAPVGDQATAGPSMADASDLDFGNLLHRTEFRRPEDAAVREASPANKPDDLPRPDARAAAFQPIDSVPHVSEPTISYTAQLRPGGAVPVSDDFDPDHDGHTVARRPRGQAPARREAVMRPEVTAVRCPAGHASPTTSTHCRSCGVAITDRSVVSVPRPSLGVLRFSTGQQVDLKAPVIIGRIPPAGTQVDGEAAEAFTIDNSELSRSHATVHLTDWYVYVVDGGSTNGTSVVVPGQPSQTCRAGERVLVTPGAVVDLGGVVTFRFDAV